jgi:hypothetical protein
VPEDQEFCRYHNANISGFPPRTTRLPHNFRARKPEDLFRLVQEMLALVVAGEVSANEAFALTHLVNSWMRLYIFMEQGKNPAVTQWARVLESLQDSVRSFAPLAMLAKAK